MVQKVLFGNFHFILIVLDISKLCFTWSCNTRSKLVAVTYVPDQFQGQLLVLIASYAQFIYLTSLYKQVLYNCISNILIGSELYGSTVVDIFLH
jgi:hypothetical protein